MKKLITMFIILTLAGIAGAFEPMPPLPASITLEAVPATVQADGISYSTIIATLSDSSGQPSAGANVYFTTNFGSLSTNYGLYPQGWLDISDSQGKAYATITSTSTGTATVTAVSGSLTKTVSVAFTTQDVTPPVISNIAASGITQNSTTITWNTNEPASSIVKYGTSSGVYTNTQADSALIMTHSLGLTGLTPGTTYYYVVNSTDASGNSAQSSEGSFTTQSPPVDITPPSVTNPSANPNEILLEEAGNADYQHMSTTLSATATDASGIASVTIDLSSIGGNPAAVMAPVGGNVYSITTNATGSPGSKSLGVTATDAKGNSNTSVSISLRVLKNGDIDGDGDVDFLGDALYLVRYTRGVPGYEVVPPLVADVDGDGDIDFLGDALYLVRHTRGVSGYEKLY